MSSIVVVDQDDIQLDSDPDAQSLPSSHHGISVSPLSILNSPTPFSFSPTGYYPSHDQYGSHHAASSYDTDITSIMGSWDPGHGQTIALVRDKGKAVDRQHVQEGTNHEVDSPPETSSSYKGKGKDVLTHHASFEFDFEPYDTPASPDPSGDELFTETSAAQPSSCRHFVLGIDPGYAGPSSRNGHTHPDEHSDHDVFSEPPSLSSTRPPSSLDYSVALPDSTNDDPTRPIHKRSFSSLSMRSLRSSSSRSIASIRSKLVPDNIKGKVKAITPSMKKLKGGFHRMLTHKSSRTGDRCLNASASEGETEEYFSNTQKQALQASQEELMRIAKQLYSAHSMESSTSSDKTVIPRKIERRPVEPLEESSEFAVSIKQRSKSDSAVLRTIANEMDDFVDTDMSSNVDGFSPRESKDCFNEILPKEIQIEVLRTLVNVYEEDLLMAEKVASLDGYVWSAITAGKMRWVGRERGMRELIKLSRVSKHWYSLIYDGQLWQSLRLTSSPPHLSPSLLLRIAEHAGPFVHVLDLRGWVHLDPVTLRVMVRSLSNEPSLDLSSRSLLSLSNIPFPPTNLTHLSLRACASVTSTALHLLLVRSPHLRNINLRALSAVTMETCTILCAHCPNLEVVDLGRCPKLDGKGLQELVDKSHSCRSGFMSTDLTHRPHENGLVSASRLRALMVSGLKDVNEQTMFALAKGAPGLEVLDMSCVADLTDEAIEAFVTWETAWDSLPLDSSFAQRRVQLSAREMGRDPSVDIGPFYKRLTHLQHLNFSSCHLLTDMTCTHLAHCVPRLEFLELGDIGSELKDEGLVRLLTTTPLLRRVDLEDASDITDAVLQCLTPPTSRGSRRLQFAPQPGQNLEHLIVSNAVNLTNGTLLALIRACKKLRILECDNTRISGAVAKEFVKLMRTRRMMGTELVVVDCRGVNESLVKELAGAGETRPRKGFRHFDARFLGFVDGRDEEDLSLGGCDVDECDNTRVALKSFWSWQAVDTIQQLKEKRRKAPYNLRRNTDPGMGSFGHRRFPDEGDEDPFGEGPSITNHRGRWLSQWARVGTFAPTNNANSTAELYDDERGCILM